MAGNQFLKVTGIEGESQEKGYEGTMEVDSWSINVTNIGTMGAGGGGGTSNVQMHNFQFTLLNGKTSPALFLACCNGKHFPEAVLSILKPTGDGNQQKFLEYTFTDLVFNDFGTSGMSGGEIPTENISFNYTALKTEQFEQAKDGSLKSTGVTGWNQKTNQPV